MQQQIKYVYTPSTNYVTKTPEKITTSPFRGVSFSDKSQLTPTPGKYNFGYPPVQQTINPLPDIRYQQYQQQQTYEQRDISPNKYETPQQLYERMNNLQENLTAIKKKHDLTIDELNKQQSRNRDIEQKYQLNQQKCHEYEQKIQQKKQVIKQMENLVKELKREIQELNDRNQYHNELQEQQILSDKLQKLIKQRDKEIIELKMQMRKDSESRQLESNRLLQEFRTTYSDLGLQNDALLQENNQLKQLFLQYNQLSQTLSSKKNSEQDFQHNADNIEDNQLRSIVEEFLFSNEEPDLSPIPQQQLQQAMLIIREIFHSINQKQLKEVKSQKFEKPKQINEEIVIGLQELKAKREYVQQEIRNKQEMIFNNKDLQKHEISVITKEIEQLKEELKTIDTLIKETEHISQLNPHRNSCVSFDDQEFS